MKKNIFLLITLLFGSLALWAQPANDACQNATNIGSPSLNQQLCAAGTNVGANPEFPYPFQNVCAAGPGMSSPADDVWFTLTTPTDANELVINLTGTLSSYNIGIYSGSCGSLSGLGCATGGAGGIVTTIRPVIQNTTYYIQVSGNGVGVQGTFNLCVRPQENTNLCVVQSNIVANPAPVNGSYNPGTVVTFCYSVTDFNQRAANWFHGISVQLGNGWQAGSLAPVSAPASCDGMGVWLWRTTVTSSATGTTAGPGFFYDSSSGGPLDGNPGNNFGDNCTNNTWTFCWSATVPSLPPNQCQTANPDLSVSIRQFGDGQTGSWSSLSCTANPAFNFSAVLECCEQPLITVSDESCPSACDGIAIAEGQGGTAPYTYDWGNGTLTDTATALCAGSYNLTVTDAVGCEAITTVVINSGAGLTISAASADESCTGASDGVAWVINPSPNLTYTWNTVPPQTGDSAFGLTAGTYELIGTGIAGCADTTTVVIGSGANLVINVDGADETCTGAADGKVWVVGASPTIAYTWNTIPSQSGDTAFALTAGTYEVTGTGTGGCTGTATVTIASGSALTITLNKEDVSCTGAANGKAWVVSGNANFAYTWNTIPPQNTDTAFNLGPGAYEVIATGPAGCADTQTVIIDEPLPLTATATADTLTCGGASTGTATAAGAGGTPPYAYSWNSTPVQNTATATNLPPATYTATIMDARGCITTVNATVVSTPSFTTSIGSEDVTCFGGNDGRAWAVPSGGQPPYTFDWNTTPPQNTDTATNLGPGNYLVVVTDFDGCTEQISFIINEPTGIVATSAITNITCNGQADGEIVLTVSGGLPPYSYQWTGGNYNQTADNLAPNTYSVVISDANGCQTNLTNLVVTEPPALSLTATPTDVSCFGGFDGAVALAVSGGTPTYTYRWSNNRITQNLNFVVANNYSVTVTDANGCQDSTTAIVAQADSFTVVRTVTNVSCRGAGDGSIDLVVSGANPPYTYVWSANANGYAGTTLTGLSGASYQVTITDSRNCTKTLSFNINEPTRFRSILSQSIDSTACDGTILVGRIGNNTNGGTQPYTYQWSSGDSTREITNNLEYGTYTLTATDANGCADTVDITLVARNLLQVQLLTDSSGCFGENTGTAEVIITGGRKPYFVAWPGLDSTNTTFVNRIAPGNYDVTVTDSKGCDTTFNFTITEQPEMSVVVPDTLNVTFGLDTSFNIEINGLRPGDESSFYWNPTEWLSCNTCTQPRITAIRNRQYIIELDVNGCLYYDTLQLMVDFGPTPYFIPNAFTPNGDNTNDYFQIFGVGIEDVVYTIHNRWGGLVFSGQGMGATWDGTYNGQLAQTGVYVYNVYFIYLDKSTERVTGTVTLLR